MSATFDQDQPADNVAARLLPSVTRANFKGLYRGDSSVKQWALNLADRDTGDPTPTEPAAIDGAFLLWAEKTGAGSNDPLALWSKTWDDDTNPKYKLFDPNYINIAASGQVSLPGGLIVKWGSAATVSTSDTTVTFADDTESFPTVCYGVWTQAHRDISSGTIYTWVRSFDKDSFKMRSATNSITTYWIAIGS